jgi:ElaB/YqjD/DUF883 family membrane-anchored ribosome-binding protein
MPDSPEQNLPGAESARETARNIKHKASDVLERAAARVREQGQNLPGGERTSRATDYLAGKAEQTAGYIRSRTSSEMMSDVGEVVRRHPVQTIVGALVAGFLIGRSARRE